MTTAIVIQARMGSTRFPGKVLAELGGHPLLELQLLRLLGQVDGEIIVATTTLTRDDPVVDVTEQQGVRVVRGSEDDVLGRVIQAIEPVGADTVVRLTADCPLSDPTIVTDAIAHHQRTGADYTSNSLIRTFPDGLDVEVISSDALTLAASEASDPAEREHVTPFLYRRPQRFRLAAFRSGQGLGHLRWTVDTPDDLLQLRALLTAAGDPISASWTTLLAGVSDEARQPARTGLRPALDEDATHIHDWATSAGSTSTGLEWLGQTPEAPLPDRYDDPGARCFVWREDGHDRGFVSVTVADGGTGQLHGRVPRPSVDAVRRALDTTLKQDLQVKELV